MPLLPIISILPVVKTERALDVVKLSGSESVSNPKLLELLRIAIDRAVKLRAQNGPTVDIQKDLKPDIEQIQSESLIGQSPKFLATFEMAKRVSKSSATVLLTGESGTGKEVFANFIHNSSEHRSGPFVAINCSSIPESLLESELFGHAKGSFTGAFEKKIGLFEAAQDGTLFLDEIGDLSLSLQAKLLRVLQEKKIRRVGENKDIAINCRVVSATHKNLVTEIKCGRFREDLFFRLNVIPITIPPLRERTEDLLNLASIFLKRFALANSSKAFRFSAASLQFLKEYKWPGNVRELENSVERGVILAVGEEVQLENLSQRTEISSETEGQSNLVLKENENVFYIRYVSQLPRLDEVINKYIAYAIVQNGGARDKTARDIGIDRKTLYRRMQF